MAQRSPEHREMLRLTQEDAGDAIEAGDLSPSNITAIQLASVFSGPLFGEGGQPCLGCGESQTPAGASAGQEGAPSTATRRLVRTSSSNHLFSLAGATFASLRGDLNLICSRSELPFCPECGRPYAQLYLYFSLLEHLARGKAGTYYREYFTELGKIGSGSFGTVQRVQHRLGDIRLGVYAAKIVSVGNSRPWLLKALREVSILEQLRHPNVVSYHHCWVEPYRLAVNVDEDIPHLFILLNYAKGGSLLNLRRDVLGRALTPREILWILAQAAAGLAHLHSIHFLSRDVKCGNFLLDGEAVDTDPLGPVETIFPPTLSATSFSRLEQATLQRRFKNDSEYRETCRQRKYIRENGVENLRVLITDFGQVGDGVTAGTQLYLAPEVYADNAHSEASDVYGLGIVILVLLYEPTWSLGGGMQREQEQDEEELDSEHDADRFSSAAERPGAQDASRESKLSEPAADTSSEPSSKDSSQQSSELAGDASATLTASPAAQGAAELAKNPSNFSSGDSAFESFKRFTKPQSTGSRKLSESLDALLENNTPQEAQQQLLRYLDSYEMYCCAGPDIVHLLKSVVARDPATRPTAAQVAILAEQLYSKLCTVKSQGDSPAGPAPAALLPVDNSTVTKTARKLAALRPAVLLPGTLNGVIPGRTSDPQAQKKDTAIVPFSMIWRAREEGAYNSSVHAVEAVSTGKNGHTEPRPATQPLLDTSRPDEGEIVGPPSSHKADRLRGVELKVNSVLIVSCMTLASLLVVLLVLLVSVVRKP